MEKFKILKKEGISELPLSVGIYALKKGGAILYIGKAKNIKLRVKNHFQQPTHRDDLFIRKIDKIGYISTGSEIEALILEANLIKKIQPKYNVVWKDDKYFSYVGITSEKPVKIFAVRRSNMQAVKALYVGPFIDGTALRKTLKVLRRIFPYYTSSKHPKKLCTWCQLKLCPGPNPNQKKYQKDITSLKKILKGKSKTVFKNLKREMLKASTLQKYEAALRLRDQLQSLEKILAHARVFDILKEDTSQWEKTEVILRKIVGSKKRISRIEAYDISNIQGQKATGSMVTFINGKPVKKFYRKFKIKISGKPNDIAMIKEVLSRRFKHLKWGLPEVILIDGGKAQLNAGLHVLGKKFASIRVAAIAKKNNELFVVNRKQPFLLNGLSRDIFNLILHLRDESHRFAIIYHRKLRKKDLLA